MPRFVVLVCLVLSLLIAIIAVPVLALAVFRGLRAVPLQPLSQRPPQLEDDPREPHAEAEAAIAWRLMRMQDENGQIQETHSVSAGLDYPGVGPEHALLASIDRVKYEAVNDDDSLAALAECCAAEGILPAIESAHALAGAKRYALANPGKRILICLSGRGDKDMPTLQRTLLKDVP